MDKIKNTGEDNKANFLKEMSKFIFTSKYARFNSYAERREDWNECIDRSLAMHLKKFRKTLPQKDLEEIKWAFDMVREKKVVSSMRSTQYGGLGVEKMNLRIFNCSARHVDSLRSMSEFMLLALAGCGIGNGYTKKYIDRLPDLVSAKDKTGTVLTYSIEDTIEGWADSIEALLLCYFKNTPFTGRKVVFDYSKIRPEGAPLKTSGGKVPGYKGLKRTHGKIKELLDYIIENLGQKRLKTINAYDILMHCADAVLSGGNRRSAAIALFAPDDKDMVNAKTNYKVTKHTKFYQDDDSKKFIGKVTVGGKKIEVELTEYEYNELLLKKGEICWIHVNPQRARSNNSVLLDRKTTTFEQFRDIVEMTKQYGEPGFAFVNNEDVLLNPCARASCTVLTPNGISTIGAIKEGDSIWSESGWTKILQKWSTGIKDVYRYRTTSGYFDGTKDHRLVCRGVKTEAVDCDAIDSLVGPAMTDESVSPMDVVDGLVIGDGSTHKCNDNLVILHIGKDDKDYFSKECEVSAFIDSVPYGGQEQTSHKVKTTITFNELPSLPVRGIPDRFFYGSFSKMRGFLRGLYSANGSLCGGRVTLKLTSEKMRDQVQVMLSALGIQSYFTTNKETVVTFRNGDYTCKQSYDINITSRRNLFARYIGFIQKYKTEKLDKIISEIGKSYRKAKNTFAIKDVKFLANEEVFDITVGNPTHTFWTGGVNVSNCAEIGFIPLSKAGIPGVQMCNLSEINGALVKNKADFLLAAKAASIIGTLQASYTDLDYLSVASKEITEEEALLGVSITGVFDNTKVLLDPEVLKEGADVVKKTNEEWAAKIHINPAARTTCIKPSGTASIVLESSSGAHPHHARQYFRRVQCNKHDPVFKFFKKLNPHMTEESVWSANKTDEIVTFPITVPDAAVVKSDLTALEHLKIVKSLQQNWVLSGTTRFNKKDVSNNVSCTVVVREDEWDAVTHYIYDNREFFTAVSLLPYIGDKLYKQAPMEAVQTDEDKARFKALEDGYKVVNYKDLIESEDNTKVQDTVACAGGACEII
jgi:hypothetical protein